MKTNTCVGWHQRCIGWITSTGAVGDARGCVQEWSFRIHAADFCNLDNAGGGPLRCTDVKTSIVCLRINAPGTRIVLLTRSNQCALLCSVLMIMFWLMYQFSCPEICLFLLYKIIFVGSTYPNIFNLTLNTKSLLGATVIVLLVFECSRLNEMCLEHTLILNLFQVVR